MNAVTPFSFYEPISPQTRYDMSAVRAPYRSIGEAQSRPFIPADGFSAKANLLGILGGQQTPQTPALLKEAMEALERLDARQGEDLDLWVKELSKSFAASSE